MRKATLVVSLLTLALFVQRARAERPPEQKESATNAVTGVINQIDTIESKFGADGVQTNYTAEITVAKVEKGEGIKAGDTIKIHWLHVTKKPSKPLPGAYGHSYAAAKKGETVRVYLMNRKSGYEVIYNPEGMEAVKK